MGVAAGAEAQGGASSPAGQLLTLANQSRAQMGAGPLRWDAALAAAAMRHCQRMVQTNALSHQFGGEPDLSQRTSAEGAHFDLIEENIAVGPYPAGIHDGWMHSPGHRRNLLNPDVDRVGIAVIAAGGMLYAVADYSRGVAVLSSAQVEAQVGELLRQSGIKVRRDPHDARLACMVSSGFPAGMTGGPPGYVMRWQGSDLQRLPQALESRVGSGQYQSAAVGSCPANGNAGAFTAYRLAVLLY